MKSCKANEMMKEFIDKYNNGKYDEVLILGKRLLHYNLTNLQRAYIYNGLAGSYRETLDFYMSAECSKKATAYFPKDMITDKLRSWSDYLFTNHYLPNTDMELAQEHFKSQKIINNIEYIYDQIKIKIRKTELLKEKKHKIRVAYISQDFIDHVNAKFFICLLTEYSKNKFDVFAYMTGKKQDNITKKIKNSVSLWRDVSNNTPDEAAKIIFNDKIDILFDLSVHAGKSINLSILAYKPAPIIISGIGYMSTSGINAVDYFLTDVYCDPPGKGEEMFSEKLLRLPYSHFCYSLMKYDNIPNPNKEIHDPIVFGCLNRYSKYSDELLNCWLNIMLRVPKSKLILQAVASDIARNVMYNRLKSLGFDMDRVEMRLPNKNYLETYLDIDIALDTYPYTGGGTTIDALYMGIPVITLCGSRHGTRFGYSIMKNIGLDVLIANTWCEYEKIAVTLANNKDILKEFHLTIRDIIVNSPLMDKKLYLQSIENEYRRIFREFLINK